MKHIKVDGHPGLVRDKKSKAILNTDMTNYKKYIKLKELHNNEDKKIENLENGLSELKSDIDEIKNLLRELKK
jgi:hypothetical protein|tara:strand:- start:201 stop:419 length:219 start_codon:yes stop_codon:yes gene_type:complete